MAGIPTCKWCQTLRHKCYGLDDKVCGQCQCDKKTCQDVMFEGESFSPFLDCPCADTMVVDSVPAAHHRVCLMVAPVKPLTQLKRVAAKGKAVSCPQPDLGHKR